MCRFARDGRHMVNLVRESAAVCRAANRQLPERHGPGRPKTFQQWQIATLIVIAVARRCETKSSQYRYLEGHGKSLMPLLRRELGLESIPSRATYMREAPKASVVFEQAIAVGGRRAIQEHVADARTVAIDKSLIPARGPCPRRDGRERKGVDPDAAFCKSAHDGWVWGYSYEVAVSVGKNGVILPLLASADRANRSEHRGGKLKVPRLPSGVRHVLADSGYDDNAMQEVTEYDEKGRRIDRRLVCPCQSRGGKPAVGRIRRKGERERHRRLRMKRQRFMQSRRGKRLYARRRETVEPFNQWFKHLFNLEERVWQRGLANNRSMLLAALFCEQTLLRYSHATGRRDAQVQWILDGL